MEIGFRYTFKLRQQLNEPRPTFSYLFPHVSIFHNRYNMSTFCELYEIKNRRAISIFEMLFVVAFSFRIICKKVSVLCIECRICVHIRRVQQHATIISQLSPRCIHREREREREFNSKMSKVFFFFFCKQLENYKQPPCHVVLYLYYKEKFKRFSQYFF